MKQERTEILTLKSKKIKKKVIQATQKTKEHQYTCIENGVQ